MRRRTGRDSVLAPMVTTLALILIALSIASGPFGWSPGEATPEQVTLSTLSDPAALEPIDVEMVDTLSHRGVDITTRGGERPGEFFVNRPMPAPDAPLAGDSEENEAASEGASTTAEAAPEAAQISEVAAAAAPSPTEVPAPTEVPDPTAEPTVEPTTEPAPEPTEEPAAEPFVAMSVPMLTGARVGIQSGHLDSAKLPAELASLRTSTGAAGKGWTEREINLQLSHKVIALLEARGVEVDLLPATVPPDYSADAFVSIHGDANGNTGLSGFKIARSGRSAIPSIEDELVSAMRAEYEAGTGLKWHAGTITNNMRHYYAFNQKLSHSVSPNTPSAILETGFLTNSGDLKLVTQEQDRVATAIADGIVRFLEGR